MKKNLMSLIALILAGLIAGGAIYLYSVKGRKTGPYEYVRKALKYIDSGKYEKAIFLLHRAFEEVPSNEDIKRNLLYGYVKYAEFLENKGDPDNAINYMDMAYEMGRSEDLIANNLAILYCDRGAKLSSGGDYVTAMDDLNNASEIALGASPKVRKNIANHLFNKAVQAYNSGDNRTVFICLNVSYAVKAQFDTLMMLGQYFYRESDLDRAEFYWEKALELRPDDAAVTMELEKVSKEIRAAERMEEFRVGYFDVKLYREYDIDMAVLENILGEIYSGVGQDLKCYPPRGTEITFYTEKDFRDIFGKDGIVRGFYDGNIKLIFIADTNDPLFSALIAHEYTHAAVSILTKNRCPAWLNEGIAVLEQTRYIEPSFRYVSAILKKNGKFSIDTLEKGFSSMGDVSLTVLSYEGAHTAVLFILDKWGWAGLQGLLARIGSGQHYANALDEEFYVSVENFEKMWNEYLIKKFGK